MSQVAKMIASIDEARAELHEAGVRDVLAAYSRGEHASVEEALESVEVPAKATANDVTLHAMMLRAHAESVRVVVAQHGHKWAPHVRERWLVRAEEVEHRLAQIECETQGESMRRAS